jgi:hypothetical protein
MISHVRCIVQDENCRWKTVGQNRPGKGIPSRTRKAFSDFSTQPLPMVAPDEPMRFEVLAVFLAVVGIQRRARLVDGGDDHLVGVVVRE